MRFGNMQLWNLVGICEACDWNEELEDNGWIRNWLMSKITDLNDDYDWVVEYRKQLQEQLKPYESHND